MEEQNTNHINSRRYISKTQFIPFLLEKSYTQRLDELILKRKVKTLSKFDPDLSRLTEPQNEATVRSLNKPIYIKPTTYQRSNSLEYCHKYMFAENKKQFRGSSAEGENFGSNSKKYKLTLNQGKYFSNQQKKTYLRKHFRRMVYGVIIILVYKANLRYLLKGKYKRKSKFAHTPQFDKIKSEPQQKTFNSSAKTKISTLSTILKSKSQLKKNKTISSVDDESQVQKSPVVSPPKQNYLLRNSIQNKTMEQFIQKELQDSQIKLPIIQQEDKQNEEPYGQSLAQYHKEFLKSHKEYRLLNNDRYKDREKEAKKNKSMSVQKSLRTTSSINTEKTEEQEDKSRKKRNLRKMQTAVMNQQRIKTIESTSQPKIRYNKLEEKKDVNRVQVFCRFSPFLQHIRTQSRVMVFKCSNSEYQNYYVMKRQ